MEPAAVAVVEAVVAPPGRFRLRFRLQSRRPCRRQSRRPCPRQSRLSRLAVRQEVGAEAVQPWLPPKRIFRRSES
jgi:hypothetical protein